MLSNYYTLALLAADLNAKLTGKTIKAAYTQDKDELVLTFDGLPEVLLLSCSPKVNTLYLHPTFSRARTNSVDVLKTVAGRLIHAVAIHPMDRVLSFRLCGELTMYARFFGPKANILLVDRDSLIIDAFKSARSITGRSYQSSHREVAHEIGSMSAIIAQEPNQTMLALIKRVSPVLGSTLAGEILFRGNLSVTTRASETTAGQIDLLEKSLATIVREIAQPGPRVYIGREPPHIPHRFSLIELRHCYEFEERSFPDVHEAMRFFVSRRRSATTLASHASHVLTTLRQHQTRLRRTAAAVEAELNGASRAEEYEKWAMLLMANLGMVEKGMMSAVLYDEGVVVTVPLDFRLSAIQNAQRYFEKAKKSRLATDQSRKRLVSLRDTLRVADTVVLAAEAVNTKEDLKEFMREQAAHLEVFGIGEKIRGQEHPPFRQFVVDGGFEVWAGKSSRNNDELTMKHARPNDLWFHARGAGGSHVVLKTNRGNGEPSKKAKEQAASIAAYYSSMKNAKMVPVVMTERKYVRKPKGSPPGTVVLDREKVIFAEPALPKSTPGHR